MVGRIEFIGYFLLHPRLYPFPGWEQCEFCLLAPPSVFGHVVDHGTSAVHECVHAVQNSPVLACQLVVGVGAGDWQVVWVVSEKGEAFHFVVPLGDD